MISRAVVGTRVLFSVNANAPWTPWCELQSSYSSSGQYNCVPGSNLSRVDNTTCYVWPGADGGSGSVVDCAKADLCMRPVCSCTSLGCTASLYRVDFDLTMSDTVAIETTGSTTFRRCE